MASRRERSAVLIDLDGTLIDSIPSLRAALGEFLGRRGLEPASDEFDRYNGPPLPDVVRGLTADHGLEGDEPSLLAEYQQIVAEKYAELARAAQGAGELIDEARKKGADLVVVTSAPRELATLALTSAGLEVDRLIAGEDASPGKPDPAPYLAALETTGVSPRRAVALEDSAAGIRSATSAGLRCIAIGEVDAAARELAWASCESLDAARPRVAALLDGGVSAVAAEGLRVIVQAAEGARAEADPDTVERAWQQALQRSPQLFDGDLLAVTGWHVEGSELQVSARVGKYREMIAHQAGAGPGISSLGVTAITVHDDRFVVARRAASMTQYPHAWEFAGSGTLPPEFAADPAAQLRAELVEETGIDEASIVAMTPLGLIEDLAEDCYDLCYRVDLSELPDFGGSPRPEYDEILVVGLEEAVELANGADAAPTMSPLLELIGGVHD